MQIGRFSVDPLIDGDIFTETIYAYPAIEAGQWNDYAELLTADGRVLNHAGGFLLRDGTETILVDNGVGPDPAPPFTGGGLPAALAAHGLEPSDITLMLFTHLHFDHIGWTTRDGEITFSQARHVANRDDWDYFFSGQYPGTRIERPQDFPHVRLKPLTDRIELWSEDTEIVKGINLRRAVGHTPGHAVIEIDSEGERGLLIGDLAHHQVELLRDDWTGVADLDPEQARRSARRYVAELIADDLPFAAAHFPGLAWGRLEEAGGVRRWTSLEPERTDAALATS